MNELKYKHKDPDIGVFFSRLMIEELKKIDRERATEYGQIFTEWMPKTYPDFLNFFPGYARPFLYEMRVHVFRRDRRFLQANEAKSQKNREQNLFIAYKENLILEKYFGNTLQESPFKWPKTRTARIEGEIDVTKYYRSPVSAASPVPLKEKTLWGVILLIIAALVAINIQISRRQKSA